MKLKTVLVLLVRSQNSKIPLIVGEHEVPILKLLHGGEDEDAQDLVVEMTGVEPPVLFIETTSADEEYARCKNYYIGNDNLPNPTRAVYPTLKVFADSLVEYVEPKEPKKSKKDAVIEDATA